MGYVKLGAGTYAFRDMDVFEALPGLRRIGYEAIEILAGEGWPTAPARLNRDDRTRLSDAIQQQGFESPALMVLLPLCEEGATQRRSTPSSAPSASWPATSPFRMTPRFSALRLGIRARRGTAAGRASPTAFVRWLTSRGNTG